MSLRHAASYAADALRREHDLRETFNDMRGIVLHRSGLALLARLSVAIGLPCIRTTGATRRAEIVRTRRGTSCDSSLITVAAERM
jgi:hypothetical protein